MLMTGMTETFARTGDGTRKARGLVLLVIAAMTLAACGESTKRVLGLQRTAPDEFAVAPRAPLSQPPDFKLRPPRAQRRVNRLSCHARGRWKPTR